MLNYALERISYTLKPNKLYQYKIISLVGETVEANVLGHGIQTIDVSELPSNIYLLRIGNKTIKFVKSE